MRNNIIKKLLLFSRHKRVIDGAGSTFNWGDFTATNAFFWSSLDLSPYAGTDVGSTPYWIELIDSAGKKATGYIGAVGGGETLSGVELITNGNMELDSNWTNDGGLSTLNARSSEQTHGGTYSRKVVAANNGIKSDVFTVSNGELYNVSLWVYPVDVDTIYIAVYKGNGIWSLNILGRTLTLGEWNLVTGKHIEPVGGTAAYISIGQGGDPWGDKTLYWDDVSTQRVLDPPSTAVHIVSSRNGTTRDWESIESGFNPNMVMSWNIR
jgi:hypothetical protein